MMGWKGFAAAAVAAVIVTAAFLGLALTGQEARTGGLPGIDSANNGGGTGGAPQYESLFLEELNEARDANGSWGGDMNTTALASYANALDGKTNVTTVNWTVAEYDSSNASFDAAGAAPAYILMYSAPSGIAYPTDFKFRVAADLAAVQSANGSWGDNVSSTALATYALAKAYRGDNATAQKGAEWLESENPRTVEDEAKTAMALRAAGRPVGERLEALNQSPNGSFGSFRDTAWTVMVLSESGDYDYLLKARDGVIWLRGRTPVNDEEMALGALAEQYYFNAAERYPVSAAASPELILPWQYAAGGFVISTLGLIGILFSRLREDEVMEGVRRQIYDHIERNPGEHVAEITRKLSLSSSSARYHLLVLEYNEKVIAHKNGKLKHYYSSHNGYGIYTNGFEYKDVLASLKNETARKMVKFIIARGGANQKSIAEHLGMHPSTVVWHARRLRMAHVIVRERNGKEILYSVNGEIEVAKVVGVLDRATF